MKGESCNSQAARLDLLRSAMVRHNISAWISPMGDPHLSEYVPECCAFIRFLTGFTGSAATVAVTATGAKLWTDSRYWSQAAKQLENSGIEIMKAGEPGVPGPGNWVAQNLPEGSVCGIDGCAISSESFSELSSGLAASGISLESLPSIIDEVWQNRPLPLAGQVFVFEHGQPASSLKLERVREEILSSGADALFLSSLDDIAWLTNCRGSDIPCNPVFTACALVTPTQAVLFTDSGKIPPDATTMLEDNGWTIRPYDDAARKSAGLTQGQRLFLDERHTCADWAGILKENRPSGTVNTLQPTTLLKSRKTECELDLLRETMACDGAALCELFSWVESEVGSGRKITEWDVSERLLEVRSRQPGFIEPSFETIAAADANAALPHYAPTPEKSSQVTESGLLLVDSGGQYTGGTTDVTRTVVFRKPPVALMRDYTAVLRGHVNLAQAVFPEGVFSSQLDSLARAPLWEIQADYGHGTGHGVGFCLCVHEGPVSISPRAPVRDSSRVFPGLVVSDEPGLYRPGQWGIRIENLVTPHPVAPDGRSLGRYLSFETLTLCPYDGELVDRFMLSPREIQWVNSYSRLVRELLSPRLSGPALDWLLRKTSPL